MPGKLNRDKDSGYWAKNAAMISLADHPGKRLDGLKYPGSVNTSPAVKLLARSKNLKGKLIEVSAAGTLNGKITCNARPLNIER